MLKDILQTHKQNTILVGKINRYLISKNGTDASHFDGTFHPSMATSCKRQLAYVLLGLNISNIGAKLRRIFDNGKYYHLRVQKYIKKMSKAGIYGIKLLTTEERIGPTEDNISSQPDQTLIIDGLKYVLELKSINDHGFKELMGVSEGYTDQIQLYMHVTGIPRTLVLYENKNDQEFKEYVITYDADTVRKILDKFASVTKANKREILPERECKGEYEYKAKHCNYCSVCFSEANFKDIVKMVKTLREEKEKRKKDRAKERE